jgi:hypothetical protein
MNRAHLIDPSEPGYQDKLDSLSPTKGYCIFIDIVGSTRIKDGPLSEWATKLHNTFAHIANWLELVLTNLNNCLASKDSLRFASRKDPLCQQV